MYKVCVAYTYNHYTVLRFCATATSASLGHQEVTVFHTGRQCNTYIVAGCCDFRCMLSIVAASHVAVSATNPNFILYTAYYTILNTILKYTILYMPI